MPRNMGGRERRRNNTNAASSNSIFEMQPSGSVSKKKCKQNYVIIHKGLKHFVANVYQKDNSELFVDNLCLRTSDKKEQLTYPFIKWTVTEESLRVKKDCVFCSIAWLNRDKKEKQVFTVRERSGKIMVRPNEMNFAGPVKNAGLAPVNVVIKNTTSRWPLAVEKIEVDEDFKQFITIEEFTKTNLLAGDQSEMKLLVNKNLLPYGAYDVPLTVSYKNALHAEIQKAQIPIRFIISSPASSNAKPKMINGDDDDNISDDTPTSVLGKKIKYMKYPKIDDPSKKKKGTIVLGFYDLPAPIRQLHKAVKKSPVVPKELQTELHEFENVLAQPLSASNYVEKFKAILNLEEFHEERAIAKFNMWKVPLFGGTSYLFRLTVGDGLAEGRPSVMQGDDVIVTVNREADGSDTKTSNNASTKNKKNMKRYHGVIKRVGLRVIVFRCEELLEVYRKYPKNKYNIQFALNRYVYRLCYRALDLLNDSLLSVLLPQGEYRKSHEKRELVFFNEDIAGNPEQVQAITNIVNRSCAPFPYIVFGPPGTGKTNTLVEAILQNWAVGKSQLVCASSNSAADVIVEGILRLSRRNSYMKFDPSKSILRIYSKRVEIASVSEYILQHEIHNFTKTNEAEFPSMERVLETPIIVGTLVTAARLSLMGVPANHFSHVFVDECGHCTEPECILAMTGILGGGEQTKIADLSAKYGWFGSTTPSAPLKTQLVLAGDPQQLGSTVHCELSKLYNFGNSLLARLLNTTDMYQRNPVTGKYNPEVITKLSRNYRSHNDILKIPNQLFYQGELLASGNPDVLNSCLKLDFLPQKKHPVIFHGVTGIEEQDNTSPSYYNMNEVDHVVSYITMLINQANEKKLEFTLKDIGVVSLYKKQVQKLVQTFEDRKWEDIDVGSVDIFQGSEKHIIIISTVRGSRTLKNASGKRPTRQLEFLNDYKRFNVALTRAKALLIVIGDPEILQHQSYWKMYMDYCMSLGTYMGSIPARYRQINQLVPLVSPKKGKKQKKATKKELETVQNGGGGGDCLKQKSPKKIKIGGGGDANKSDEASKVGEESSVKKSEDSTMTNFQDTIMSLEIEDFVDDRDQAGKKSKSESPEEVLKDDESCNNNVVSFKDQNSNDSDKCAFEIDGNEETKEIEKTLKSLTISN
ncbi:putative helicase mov-10-B.1 isoform X2 [Nilaparvata lugens]|uniref:putative helicase mov-10-B.1 isoform X2 n=1 Tax=Nilaparvata lugens TaxID=108931 RepID=UPI00193D7B53|nr:putative helicase mov-10-B.1 isoform X2 [Nilaparvata lugens]